MHCFERPAMILGETLSPSIRTAKLLELLIVIFCDIWLLQLCKL